MKFTLDIEESSASLIASDESDTILGYMVMIDVHSEGWIVEHTIVEEHGRGKGTGKALLSELIQISRENNRYIVPLCPFVFGQFSKYPDQAEGRAQRATSPS